MYLNSRAAPPVARLRADEEGAFAGAGALTLPLRLEGTHTFILVGQESLASTTVDVQVQPFTPQVEPSAYSGLPGTTVTFYGTGFARGEVVRVYAGGEGTGPRLVACGRADGEGRLRGDAPYTLEPALGEGRVTFLLEGASSGGVATTSMEVGAPRQAVAVPAPALPAWCGGAPAGGDNP